MSRDNLMDPNNWANPRIGAIVLGAWLAEPSKEFRCDYRSCGMSARELMEELQAKNLLGHNYFEAKLSEDRVWVIVTLSPSARGASVCSFGYLENNVGRVSPKGFWTRWGGGEGEGIYHAL